MAAVPVGILLSNQVYGILYDQEYQQQLQIQKSNSTLENYTSLNSSSTCVGSQCYSKAFGAFLGIQVLPVLTAGALLCMRVKYSHNKKVIKA